MTESCTTRQSTAALPRSQMLERLRARAWPGQIARKVDTGCLIGRLYPRTAVVDRGVSPQFASPLPDVGRRVVVDSWSHVVMGRLQSLATHPDALTDSLTDRLAMSEVLVRFLVPWLAFVVLVVAWPLFAQEARPSPTEASLEQSVLPAAGRHQTTFRVPSFGRWSVALSSDRGVALQLVDRVNGPGPIIGAAGERDGRVDVFLDRGEYQVISRGAETENDLGQAKLSVRAFREIEERAVTLPDLAEVETQLSDLQQVSWWVELSTKQRVAFEAAGRHLEDLRLWRDGTWMVGTEPTFEDVEPVLGRPLRIARLADELPAGLYRLTAYGGAGLPWAEDDGTRPLYLRSGVPKRGEAGRSRMEISSFGIDRFVVPASASYYRLEVPAGDLRGDSVHFEVDDWVEADPYEAGDAAAETVDKELRELAVVHQRSVNEDGRRVMTIRGVAGQPYVLQHFRSERAYRFKRAGEYWIDTIHSGHPADSVEATAMLFEVRRITRYATPLRAEVVRLRRTSHLNRRFNLLEPATLFIEAVERGSYSLRLDGIEAQVRLEPYLLPGQELEERPPERRLEPGESTDWDLDPGYYLLTLEPVTQGVADVTLGATSADGAQAGSDPGSAPTARLGRVFLSETTYLLHQNEQARDPSRCRVAPTAVESGAAAAVCAVGRWRPRLVDRAVPGTG